jgi:hypothetical protein
MIHSADVYLKRIHRYPSSAWIIRILHVSRQGAQLKDYLIQVISPLRVNDPYTFTSDVLVAIIGSRFRDICFKYC